jgi:methylated-DNA-[protein]-cysteine S-methyltransferase
MPFLIFPTAFGSCGIAWGELGLTRFSLPEETEALTARRMASGGDKAATEGALPDPVRAVVVRVRQHFAGDLQDFSDATFHWPLVSDFQHAVYLQALLIKPGHKRSYGDVARAMALGNESARAVGVALATNPWPLLVPCHRVVSANDRMTGFSAPGGVRTKTRLLALEGAELLSE